MKVRRIPRLGTVTACSNPSKSGWDSSLKTRHVNFRIALNEKSEHHQTHSTSSSMAIHEIIFRDYTLIWTKVVDQPATLKARLNSWLNSLNKKIKKRCLTFFPIFFEPEVNLTKLTKGNTTCSPRNICSVKHLQYMLQIHHFWQIPAHTQLSLTLWVSPFRLKKSS